MSGVFVAMGPQAAPNPGLASLAPQRIVDTGFITLHTPWTVGLSFLGLELTVVFCGVLAFLHALGKYRRGDGAPLFTWGISFTYGLLMEIGSYNFADAFAHGQFSVMFYRHQLPLYVVTVYPVLQYTSIMAARRLRLGLVAEAFAAGLLIVAMDCPFDIIGPTQGWWWWFDHNPNMAYRWLGVPVTSYYWHLAWGGILAALTRVFARWGGDPKKPARIAILALPVSMLTIFFGLIAFVPFHVLKSRGVADGSILTGLIALSLCVVAVSLWRVAAREGLARTEPKDRRLLAIPVLYFGYHLLVALACLVTGVPGFGPKMAAIAVVTAAALAAHGLVYRSAGEPSVASAQGA
jgi:hypothetical protein